jgi:hypothetical protein
MPIRSVSRVVAFGERFYIRLSQFETVDERWFFSGDVNELPTPNRFERTHDSLLALDDSRFARRFLAALSMQGCETSFRARFGIPTP